MKNKDTERGCPFVMSGECDVPPCNTCFLNCKGNVWGRKK
jgi:hypothetical protein